MRRAGWWIGCFAVWIFTPKEVLEAFDLLAPFILGAIHAHPAGVILGFIWMGSSPGIVLVLSRLVLIIAGLSFRPVFPLRVYAPLLIYTYLLAYTYITTSGYNMVIPIIGALCTWYIAVSGELKLFERHHHPLLQPHKNPVFYIFNTH